MSGRPCQICADAANLRLAAEMIAVGVSDQAVAKAIGGISRMAVARHRQNHIERPAKAILAATNKGRDTREEREQLVAAAEQGDVGAAFLSLERTAADLRRVQERLERTAEGDQQRLAVASLSGQQLRAAEVRAKLAGIGGYATPRSDGQRSTVRAQHPLLGSDAADRGNANSPGRSGVQRSAGDAPINRQHQRWRIWLVRREG